MKKFLFLLIAMFTMATVNVNAQAKFSGNIGATVAVEPHNSHLTSFPLTVNGGVGAQFDNGFYVGGGIGLGTHLEYAHANGVSETEASFIMPIYVQASYIKPNSYYADMKIGEEEVISDGHGASFFFMELTPVGYTFNNRSSIGLGWRFHSKNAFSGNAISLTYRYNF